MLTDVARSMIRLMPSILALAWLLSTPATAVLQRYEMRRTQLNQQLVRSPKAEFEPQPQDRGVALVDDSAASPVLRRYVMANPPGDGLTVVVPALAGFAWFRIANATSPGPDQTGTGSTATSIDWGNLTGWTTSGGLFCHSIPSYVCGLGGFIDNGTVPSVSASTNFDYGTWVFHSTGFTHPGGRIIFTIQVAPGNIIHFDRGFRTDNGVVPALPLLGIAGVAMSVVALGISAVRRKR